ncbi:MAG TPA: peptidylprolyl isomerase [Ginsengibacter sp.]|nr:peptidylprolyl isomerase [Chitinophagaceae bacterium]HRN71672.1 peptidylprolyl isomerase [Ginsengibacter sp.]HRP17335.1 peptidylprolyl isomerase [Ginsengibacter sp.]HRP44274.1 peptidylprolyl isomerase [Ginsengibacter sp.]
MKKIFPGALLLLLVSCGGKQEYSNPTVEIKTTYGKILVELYPQKAPQTVAAFLKYVDSGYYKKSTFYRVLKEEDQPSNAFKSELIQGGIYQSNPQLLVALPGIPLETTKETGLRHLNGTISLARTSPNSGSTEFFICVGDQPAYDYGGLANPDGLGYAAFGRVIKGMNAVRNIHSSPSDGTSFIRPVEIADIIYLNPSHKE